jgi:AcrR family transcriptional regulator
MYEPVRSLYPGSRLPNPYDGPVVEGTLPDRRRDAERTKKELLEVATREFADQGFAGARVDEIANQTRTTKRMIYYYFGSKEQLFVAVLERAYASIRAAEQTIEVDHSTPSRPSAGWRN